MISPATCVDTRALPRTGFDVAAYTREAQGRISVDAERITREHPDGLDARTRADLAFCRRLDAGALSELRALLASATGREARITAFCATWAYERHWFARAQADLLASGGAGHTPVPAARLRDRARALHVEHTLPILAPLRSGLRPDPTTAGQMARLALQEAGLRRAQLTLHERLRGHARTVLAEIIDRRERLITFFTEEARVRSSHSAGEAAAVRRVLRHPASALRIAGVADPDERRALTSLHLGSRPAAVPGQASRGL